MANERSSRAIDGAAKLDALQRRPVRVVGLAGMDGARLVAEFYGRASTERWWAVVRDGAARFPTLSPGSWTLTLEGVEDAIVREGEVPGKKGKDGVLLGREADPRREVVNPGSGPRLEGSGPHPTHWL